ncbi:hypothetical protein P175DRAFT_0529322 [Aspergillus ochraceoroseus IBT 24754]|uniref:Major facilitator superfamily (MFS) profile domain-containing protein n=2 Tax=Aspergillus ochraceoroseus TaxID=138278 RepID=A0A2T5M176_9EURO|nr:uncharacterized protein P175DRAFT_0529322 [Aspergillus ochraceoroseus IBT 24754]KKK21935.1 hypothetical protein AOCH_000176 [Aspergillus ochraceoroseus]PTU22280.1 hypothetical protein P175DRAFT_0529322 [Aspergillus ochraceoroseus IBT 24754]
MPTKKKSDARSQASVERGDVITVAPGTHHDSGVDQKRAAQDKALNLLAEHHVDFDPNSSEAKRVLRKIDMRILPMTIAIYTFMLMDKNSLSFSALMGIKQDNNLTPGQYSWLGSIVYIGYLCGEIPAAFLMQRVPLRQYFGCMCMLWGIVVAMHAVCHNFAGLATVRFLLGAIETCTAPIVIQVLGAWYTKEEQVSRVAIWYTSSGWANVGGGFFAWAIYQAGTFRWQALFIFYGCMTFLIGAILYFLLAASPTDAQWLTDEEKTIALERVRSNKTGTEIWRFNQSQLIEAFCDPRFYIIFVLLVCTGLPNGGLTVFGPSIITGFGFTTSQSTLLYMAPGAAAVLGTGVACVVAKYTNRTIAGIFPLVLSCIGIIMMFTIPSENYSARYGGYVLTMQFPICVLFIITYMTAGVGGSTKKLAFGASYQLGYTVGNIVGPQTYRESDAPNYYIAKYTMLAFIVMSIILIAVTGSLHKYWNIKRDRMDTLDAQQGTKHEQAENEEFMDLTDFQQRSFRYPV